MTLEARDWLPVEAAAQEAVQARVRSAVRDWSERWFSRREISAGAAGAAREAPRLDGAGWVLHGQAVALSCGRRSTNRLLGWALDMEMDQLSHTDTDRDLLDAFEQSLLGDLIQTVETSLGLNPQGAITQPRTAGLPLGALGGALTPILDPRGDELAILAVPLNDIMSLCKRRGDEHGSKPAPLGRLLDALASADIKVEVNLGRSEISLVELRGLAPGDVIILDTALDDGIPIGVSGSDTVIARGELTSVEGNMALTLLARP